MHIKKNDINFALETETNIKYDMIKKQGSFAIHDDETLPPELIRLVEKLPEGVYKYYILDDKKNSALPQLKYLFGIVLKTISDELPDHPPVGALYRFFEELYAPIHTSTINGEKYDYFDLKAENSIEMNNVIADIIHHAASQWGITIKEREDLKLPEASEAYMDAYLEMWKNPLNNNIIHTK